MRVWRALLALAFGLAALAAPASATPQRRDCASAPLTPAECLHWVTTYDSGPGAGNASTAERPVAMTTSTELVFVAGMTASATATTVTPSLAAYDRSTGAERWRVDLTRGNTLRDGVQLADGGRSVLAATVTGSGEAGTATLSAYDAATGALRWTSDVAGTGVAYGDWIAGGLAVTPDGSTAILSVPEPIGDGWGIRTTSFDAATGDRGWSRSAPQCGPFASVAPGGVAVTSGPLDAQRVIVVGEIGGCSQGQDMVVFAYDLAGMPAWSARVNTGVYSRGWDAVVNASGDTVYVVGSSKGISSFTTFAGAHDVATGKRRWVQVLPDAPAHDQVRVTAADDTDGVVVGYMCAPTGLASDQGDACAVALGGTDGAIRWTRRLDAPGEVARTREATTVAVGANGVVYMGGSSPDDGTDDLAVTAFDERTGEPVGSLRYEAAPGDVPRFEFRERVEQLLADPATGELLIAGTTSHPTTGVGWAVLSATFP